MPLSTPSTTLNRDGEATGATTRRSLKHLWVIVFVASGISVALLGTKVFRRTSSARPTEYPDRDKVRALEARVSILEARLRALTPVGRSVAMPERQPFAPAEPTTEAQAADRRPSGQHRSDNAAKDEEADETLVQQQYFRRLDHLLAAETIDPMWSAEAEQRLRGFGDDFKASLTLESAHCRTSLCRAEIQLNNPDDQGQVMTEFLWATRHLLPDAATRSTDQPGRSIMYFARQGAHLPSMESVLAEGKTQ